MPDNFNLFNNPDFSPSSSFDFGFLDNPSLKKIDKNLRTEKGFVIMYNRVGDCRNKVVDTNRGINNINK